MSVCLLTSISRLRLSGVPSGRAHEAEINALADRVDGLGELARAQRLPLVVCRGDLHASNIQRVVEDIVEFGRSIVDRDRRGDAANVLATGPVAVHQEVPILALLQRGDGVDQVAVEDVVFAQLGLVSVLDATYLVTTLIRGGQQLRNSSPTPERYGL